MCYCTMYIREYVLTSNLKSSRGAGFLEMRETARVHNSEGTGT